MPSERIKSCLVLNTYFPRQHSSFMTPQVVLTTSVTCVSKRCACTACATMSHADVQSQYVQRRRRRAYLAGIASLSACSSFFHSEVLTAPMCLPTASVTMHNRPSLKLEASCEQPQTECLVCYVGKHETRVHYQLQQPSARGNMKQWVMFTCIV